MEVTIKEYAQIERVTERTVRNWIAKGAVKVRRLPGGRLLRIQLANAGGVTGGVIFSLSEAETSGNDSV